MGNKTYKIFKFPVNHFLEFIGKPKNNNYQIKKLIKFLQRIEPITDNFSEGSFRSYVVFPYLKVERKKSWWGELVICFPRILFLLIAISLTGDVFKLSG